jgi:hypothetical protein
LYRKFEIELNNAPPGILSYYADSYVLLGEEIAAVQLDSFGYRVYEKFSIK